MTKNVNKKAVITIIKLKLFYLLHVISYIRFDIHLRLKK